MASLLPCTPTILSTPFANRTTTHLPLRPHSHAFPPSTKRFLRGSLSVARFGFQPGFLPEPEDAEFVIRELYNRAEGLIYTIADAAVSSSDTVVTTTTATAKQNNDWFSGITNSMETVLKILKDGLSTLHVPYAYGFAIIMLTVLVKAATFPLTRKQVESAMAMRSLQPQIKAIQKQYAGDQERIQLETARLYKLANINPLAGCLPVLLTTPVWIGLYRAFSNVADEDGHPPLGWPDTLAYLVLPIQKNDPMQIQKSVSKLNSTKVEDARKGEKLTPEGPQPGDRFKQLMELEARKKQQREEEKRKAEEAAAKANHEQTIEGRNQAVGNIVENSQSVGADTDPSISGVVNGNPLSKDLEGNQNSTSKSGSENDEGSDNFNAVNEKSLEKEPREVLTTTTTNKQPHGEDPDHVTKD
ncbi:hypothetical protein TSUD_300930 [Trifolium subterraneum]|uniref:Membrane insertase YidC/Oxa/ALB C-terminal domain-containing protein n=1 Tax=Trifolium subterraneum TaxID=3900 RepID=A0A2Z6NH72_TRISU|nr:hypothetical protein TSUD_300930 [Trifolium subterraneum]